MLLQKSRLETIPAVCILPSNPSVEWMQDVVGDEFGRDSIFSINE